MFFFVKNFFKNSIIYFFSVCFDLCKRPKNPKNPKSPTNIKYFSLYIKYPKSPAYIKYPKMNTKYRIFLKKIRASYIGGKYILKISII